AYSDLVSLPPGSQVGTSSLRRESQLRARFPGLEVRALRGNVHTRLRKLDEGAFAAIILAAAGLHRLGLEQRITRLLAPEEMLPAVGQGALGIECLSDRPDLLALLAPLDDPATRWCVEAERALSAALAGSCNVPLCGFAQLEGDGARLRGFVASPDGTHMVSAEIATASAACIPEALGRALAAKLIERGAREILAALDTASA
ncbi:MAG: hydroxymethylbilane synthase, partial [Burkholderiales bacterium]